MFLVIAAIVLTLPLLLATLMRNMTLPGVLLALALIGAATVWELPLLQHFHRQGSGPGTVDLLAINVFTAAVVLMVAAAVRLNSHSLARLGPKAATVA